VIAVSTPRAARAGLQDPNRRSALFLFLGPTGVGKTELSKTLASSCSMTTRRCSRVDMSSSWESTRSHA
jgi:ATP-dependent Clp protease ATP-binding subunit ClpB